MVYGMVGTYLVEGGHVAKHQWFMESDDPDQAKWLDDGEDRVDIWRLDYGYHNGPECKACGVTLCMHCNRDWQTQECNAILDGEVLYDDSKVVNPGLLGLMFQGEIES
jgi:hypothetical protein